VAPPEGSEEAGRRAGDRALIRRYPIGHFDIYVGQDFQQAVADQVDFLTTHLQ
jgi:hypothetical protein